jgi:hypothetical protein
MCVKKSKENQGGSHMGGGRWNPSQWDTYSSAHVTSKSATSGAGGIFTSTKLADALNPKGVHRESVDSPDNPNSTPVAIFIDVTGSMARLLDAMARKGLPTLATEILDRKPVTDPHLMFGGIGDAFFDRAPLQVTQFEADIRIAEQLTDLWLEEGGGGNKEEGYILAWYMLAKHTSIDSMKKRGKKGIVFTIGDDGPTSHITPDQAKTIFGDSLEANLTAAELLTMVSREWEVFHLCVEDGNSSSPTITHQWKELLGERAISLTDHRKMGEVIVSLLQVLGGADKKTVVDSWDGSTGLVVSQAIKNLSVTGTDGQTGLVKF